MKRNILWAFILMAFCVAGITALQLYYSYVNYGVAQAVFKKDTNEALQEAIDSAFSVRRENTVAEFGKWMRDTSFVKITSVWNEKERQSKFTVKEMHPSKVKGQYEITLSADAEKNDIAAPWGQERFIIHMQDMVRGALKKGSVVYYTQGRGERLNTLFLDTPVDITIVDYLYCKSLAKRGIDLPFVLLENKKASSGFCTKRYSIAVKDTEKRDILACFANADIYLLGQLKWIIGGSMLLIIITIICFWYTIKTLLSQEKLNRIKDDFISNMTHEIHSPISSVIITAEALKEFEMDRQERDTYLDIILHQSQKLTALADEILAGARLEKKGIVLEDTIHPDKFINDMLPGYKDKAVITFKTDDIVSFKGNKSHLARAIANVLDNAVKYAPDSEIVIESRINVNEIVITVADNGPGIPDAFKTKIFEKFYRIPTGNVHNVKGYGLGLSYVKKVVQAHGGTVTVKDNSPTGSVFIIRIPYEA
jgi:nitrogen-specific signal transduction histidine kinase